MNNTTKQITTQTGSISASITYQMAADLKAYGIDVEAELEKILMSELNAATFDNFANGIKSQNREGKIDSILEDKDFTPINIEDTEEFKKLSDENKEKFRKNGTIFNSRP
jgi:precorrin-6B methylase 2